MDSKVTYVAMGVVVLVLAIGIAFVALSDDNGNDPADDVTFLIQDDDGVYFWAFGEGATVMDAFKDAVEKNDMPFKASGKDGVDDGISELFGLKMEQIGTEWFWWTQYTWTDDAWIQSDLKMNNYTPEDAGHYVACVYGNGTQDAATFAKPSDAVVWDHSTDGMVFTIQNGDNLYFKVNGQGETAMDAFEDVCDKYKIAHEFSGTADEPNGITWLFNDGLNMVNPDPLKPMEWVYWVQYYKNVDDTDWAKGDMMNVTKVTGSNECLLKYESTNALA